MERERNWESVSSIHVQVVALTLCWTNHCFILSVGAQWTQVTTALTTDSLIMFTHYIKIFLEVFLSIYLHLLINSLVVIHVYHPSDTFFILLCKILFFETFFSFDIPFSFFSLSSVVSMLNMAIAQGCMLSDYLNYMKWKVSESLYSITMYTLMNIISVLHVHDE